jgi:hypothetical protein
MKFKFALSIASLGIKGQFIKIIFRYNFSIHLPIKYYKISDFWAFLSIKDKNEIKMKFSYNLSFKS